MAAPGAWLHPIRTMCRPAGGRTLAIPTTKEWWVMSGEYASVGTQTSGVTDRAYAAPQAGLGWISFAVVMLGIAGTLNVIYGIAAIGDSNFYVGEAKFVFSNLNTWGWIVLVFGVTQLIAALSIWADTQFGRWLGILVASLSAIVALLFLPASPFGALALFALDILIVYGLVAHGGRREEIR
jgi:hypothetical protein